jgi:hypothetical protein
MDAPLRNPRPFLHGSSDQLAHDLARLAAAGWSLCTLRFDVTRPDVGAWLEQVQRFGEEVLPIVAPL